MRKYAKYIPIISLAALMAAIAAGLLIFWPYSTTVVLVVRHADTTVPGPACTEEEGCPIPVVNPAAGNRSISTTAGEARRDELWHVVEDTGIQAIYASCFCRAQQTVATVDNNLAAVTTIKKSQHKANAGATDLEPDVADLVDRINTTHVGQKVLVAGHQSTVKQLILDLGGGTIDDIGGTEFDNLYVVTITRGWWRWWGWGKRVRLVRLKYGVPT